MALITIEHSHSLSSEEALDRVDQCMSELASTAFPGVDIENVQKNRDGSRIEVSFQAKKAFVSLPVKGEAVAQGQSVWLQVDLPDIVLSFVPRQEIEQVIRAKLGERLA